jgi:hypothetical protein
MKTMTKKQKGRARDPQHQTNSVLTNEENRFQRGSSVQACAGGCDGKREMGLRK